ncbi:conserved hypothetical protein [Vibrio phage 277E43-1]|nr:conserved hypothetical protein [Vibrio phage 277E43-1]
MSNKEYPLFDNRYTLAIGSRGGLTVNSNIAHKPKAMKVYGKGKEGLRFVNLTPEKGGDVYSYCIDSLKQFVLKGGDIIPLTESEVMSILTTCKPPTLLDKVEDILKLPKEYDQQGNLSYVEVLEDFTRYYTRNDWKNASNGFLKYNYKVTTMYSTGPSLLTTNNKTCSFVDRDKVIINNLSEVEDCTLEGIIALLSEEKSKRGSDKKFMEKLNYQIAMEDLIR